MFATEGMVCQKFNDTFDECYKGFDLWEGNGKAVQVEYNNGMEVVIRPKTRLNADVWINGLNVLDEEPNWCDWIEEGCMYNVPLVKDELFVVGYRNVLSITHKRQGHEKIRLPWGDVSNIKAIV